MKKLEIPGKVSLHKSLPLALAAVALLVTGCPHNDYVVELKPQGNSIDRTLRFSRAEESFDSNELAAITALYPAHSLTVLTNKESKDKSYVIRGVFTHAMPDDVGGAGAYSNLVTSLGEAGFYVERFRGNDDLTGMAERRSKAADQLTDLIIGWSRMELRREPGYKKLRQFIDVNFRRDLKNFSEYMWEAQTVNGYDTNANEEFTARFGQYLYERGYFTIGELPGLIRNWSSNDDSRELSRRMRRLVAGKMGVPDSAPVPACLAFLADEKTMKASFDKYLAGTDLYRARLKQWKAGKKLNPDLKQPPAEDVAGDAFENLMELDDSNKEDQLVVRLSLPSSPVHGNGRWDEALKQEVWETELPGRTNIDHLPFTCYASWARADEEFQKQHIGKVALTGEELTQYCLWRSGLDAQQGGQWDGFLAGLQTGGGWWRTFDAFRFSGETIETTNGPSAYPRKLIEDALQ